MLLNDIPKCLWVDEYSWRIVSDKSRAILTNSFSILVEYDNDESLVKEQLCIKILLFRRGEQVFHTNEGKPAEALA